MKNIRNQETERQKTWPANAGMVFFLLLAIFIRLRFLEVPLERDEGEYAYMGQNLLRGILPYSEAYNMKFPGIYFIYAAILVLFGQTHTGIHLALLFVNISTSLMLYLIGRRWIDDVSGFVAGSSFLVLTLSPSLQGYWANSEHFVIFFVSIGFFLVLLAEEKGKEIYIFFSGLFLGASFLIKQHAIFFPIFGFLYVCSMARCGCHQNKFRACLIKAGLFFIGSAIPFLLTIILFSTQGQLGQFFFWTFRYAAEYASQVSISDGIFKFKKNFFPVMLAHFPIFVLFFFGLAGTPWIKPKSIRGAWVYGFFIASFLAVCPGWFFRPHYFVFLLPSIALLAGIGASFILKKLPLKKWAMAAAAFFFISVFYPVFSQGKLLLNSSPHELCRTVYGLNPFPESMEIARFIKENTGTEDAIAVLGSEPQIYFYSSRKAATGYIYAYPLMESHGFALKMQKEMIRQIESAAPKYILYVNIPTSWQVGRESELMIFDWLNTYLDKGYIVDGVVDIISSSVTVYKWGEEARSYSPVSGVNFFIFRKKEETGKQVS